MATSIRRVSARFRPLHSRSVPSQRNFSICTSLSSEQFRRSDFSGQGFTGYYEPDQPTAGPLGDVSVYGAPQITPRVLEQHLSSYIVGQDRAKRVTSVAVYNHYLRVREMQRQEEEAERLMARQERQFIGRHPVEDPDEFPGQPHTINSFPSPPPPPQPRVGNAPLIDQNPVTIEKSNVLMLGPSGVGKTLIAKTLARVLEVPYSMSDCTPFTQAGYIGEDVEVCIQRLLAAANYDATAAERGIIVLDEIDKIATAKVSHGKDVSGEGVQQALLKIIEGTTVQVQAKQERGGGNSASSRSQGMPTPGSPTNSPLSGGTAQPPGKGETYNVNTDNILFICSGAFVGLHKIILERIAKGSMGFGARVRGSSLSSPSRASSDSASANDPMLDAGIPENDELFARHMPFFAERPAHTQPSALGSEKPKLNILDLVTPTDLHAYGLIPELTGRLPITTALAPLTIQQLTRVLTEPRNALLDQYTATFSFSSIELRFTTAALHALARAASAMGTGARGLRTVMERTLHDAQFEAPGSGVRHVLVTARAVEGKERVGMWGREGRAGFRKRLAAEEEEWNRRHNGSGKDGKAGDAEGRTHGFGSFEQYREKAKVAGSG